MIYFDLIDQNSTNFNCSFYIFDMIQIFLIFYYYSLLLYYLSLVVQTEGANQVPNIQKEKALFNHANNHTHASNQN